MIIIYANQYLEQLSPIKYFENLVYYYCFPQPLIPIVKDLIPLFLDFWYFQNNVFSNYTLIFKCVGCFYIFVYFVKYYNKKSMLLGKEFGLTYKKNYRSDPKKFDKIAIILSNNQVVKFVKPHFDQNV